MLDQLIELAQIQGGIDTECRFGGTWQYSTPLMQNTAVIHIARSGQGWLYLKHKKIRIKTGDVLFFPHGSAHQLIHFQENADQISIQEEPFSAPAEIESIKQASGLTLKTNHMQQQNLNLFCAHFSYAKHADLFIQLPDLVQLNIKQLLLEPLLNLLEQETIQEIGQIKVINALSEVLLVYIFRSFLNQQSQFSQEISAIPRLIEWNSSKLNRLIHAILQFPESKWSLDDMSQFLHCSRIQLIRIFKKDLNITPHAFLLKIRLQHAALQLKTSHLPIYNIALNLGFQSETHFGRVFKQHYGMTPHLYRNTTQ